METIWIGELAHLAPHGSPANQSAAGLGSFNHDAFGSHLLSSIPASFGLLFCSPPAAGCVSPPERPWAPWTCFLSDDGTDQGRWDEVAWKESLVQALGETNDPAAIWGRVDAAERSFTVDVSAKFIFGRASST